MSMGGEIAEEYYEPITAQLKIELAVLRAGLDHAVAALTAISDCPPSNPGSGRLAADQALKEIAAITATLRKE